MVATGRVQMSRVRMKRADGSWLWVDTTYHNYLADPHHGYVLAECIDVSAEMAAQEALQDREELLRRLIDEMPDGLLQLDRERNVVFHNTRLLEILHLPAGAHEAGSDDVDAAGVRSEARTLDLRDLTEILADDARDAFDAILGRALSEGVSEDIELEASMPFGERRNILVKVRPLMRDHVVVSGVIASVQDVTDSARVRRELEQRATFDALTGAHNRSSIIAALGAELEASADTGVVYVDLDRFKSVNDTYGHPAGDQVLVEVSKRLKAVMRSSDELGRLGGDEFLVLLRGVRGRGVAMDAAERISKALRGMFVLPHASFELCASLGVACAADSHVNAEELIEQADTAMYRSKAQRCGVPVLALDGELAVPLDRGMDDTPVSASRC